MRLRLDPAPVDPNDPWRRTSGTLEAKLRWLLALAVVTTILAASVGPRSLWFYVPYESHGLKFWFCNGLAIGLGVWLIVGAWGAGRVSRWVRIAVLLPFAHLAAIVVAWQAWRWLATVSDYARASSPFIRSLPALEIAFVVGAVVVVAACIHAAIRRRVGRWLDGVVIAALLALILLGLWLPIACNQWYRTEDDWYFYLPAPAGLALLALVPPFALAIAASVGLVRRRRPVSLGTRAFAVGVLAALALWSIGNRVDATRAAYLGYSNFVHVLIGVGVVAILSIAALGCAHVIGGLRSRRAFAGAPLVGTVAGTGVIARIAATSWLRAPTAIVEPFEVITPGGSIPVPAGVEIVGPIPIATTRLRIGESAPLVGGGDAVMLAGYVVPDAAHPFRGGIAPVPGTRGIFVSAYPQPPAATATSVWLALWRPCVAYLVIVAVIGLIACAGLLGSG